MNIRKIKKELLSSAPKLDSTDVGLFADATNLVCPIDTEDNIIASVDYILGSDAKKIYNSSERLYMLKSGLNASQQFNNDELTERITKLSEGGEQSMDKVYTEDELKAEVKKQLDEKVQEKVQEEIAKISKDSEVKALNEKVKEAEDKTKAAEDAKVAAEKAADDAKAAKEAIEKAQADKELAEKRMKEMTEAGYSFDKTNDIVFESFKSLSDEQFANFKDIIEDVKVEAQASNDSDDDSDDNVDDKTDNTNKDVKANLVNDSKPPVNNASDGEKEKFASFDKIFSKK